MADVPTDPWKNFPGGNPFGPNGPFGPEGPFGPGGPFSGGDPLANIDAWLRQMGVDPKEFRGMFDEMQRNLQDAFRSMGQDPSKGFVAGFNVRIGPDGKPQFSSFGNKPSVSRTPGGVPTIASEGREPLTDVIEDQKSIAVTMELPGVEKGDIDLNMTAEALEVSVDNERRKYHKRVRLPAPVDPATTRATYNNGVLDVTVQKVKPDVGGVRIPVE